MSPELYLPVALLALLAGLVVGKAWERYKLRDGRWIDRRRLRVTPHYMVGLNFLADNQGDRAVAGAAGTSGGGCASLRTTCSGSISSSTTRWTRRSTSSRRRRASATLTSSS